MKVLFLHLGRSFAGPEFLLQLTNATAHNGEHQVFVAHNPDAGLKFDIDETQQLALRTYSSKLGFILNSWRILKIGFSIRRFLAKHEIDLVVSPMVNYYQDFSLPIWKTAKVKYWPIIHDAKIHEGDESVLQAFTTRQEIKYADKIVTLSKNVASKLSEFTATPIQALWHPPLFDFFRASQMPTDHNQKSEVAQLVFFGRLQKYKGISMMLEAAQISREAGSKFDLHIYGDGPEAELANSALGANAFWHVGYLSNEEVAACISSADWVLLPYQEASQSGVVSICQTARSPMIATNVEGLSEQLAQSGGAIIASGHEAHEFAAAITAALAPSSNREHTITSFSVLSGQTFQTFSKALLGSDNETV